MPSFPASVKVKTFSILVKQEMMGWQWHQLDHMQIICTSLQTYNHDITSSISFHRPDALPDAQPKVFTAEFKFVKSFELIFNTTGIPLGLT